MIEIFSQVRKLFFSRLLLSSFKEFSLYQEIPSRWLSSVYVKSKKKLCYHYKAFSLPSIHLGCDHWVYDLSAGTFTETKKNHGWTPV